ncbi:MAG: urease subunit beta [Acidimicrobiales bacterium]
MTTAEGTPGEVIVGHEPVVINEGREVITVSVTNTGDRPVQVGSHFHFAETNPALVFDRAAARGHRLAVPAGTSVRFEPGADRDVELVAFGGWRYMAGFRGDVGGPLGA